MFSKKNVSEKGCFPASLGFFFVLLVFLSDFFSLYALHLGKLHRFTFIFISEAVY